MEMIECEYSFPIILSENVKPFYEDPEIFKCITNFLNFLIHRDLLTDNVEILSIEGKRFEPDEEYPIDTKYGYFTHIITVKYKVNERFERSFFDRLHRFFREFVIFIAYFQTVYSIFLMSAIKKLVGGRNGESNSI